MNCFQICSKFAHNFNLRLYTVVVLMCVMIQMNYLNKALDIFNTAVVTPIYYVMFTTLTLTASSIMFKDYKHQAVKEVISQLCGFVTILAGREY